MTGRRSKPRVLACCGGMAKVFGLERMTFELLRVLRDQQIPVHCIVNTWAQMEREDGQHPIVELAEQIGASWSTGCYWYRLSRRTRNPFKLAQMAWDIVCTSCGLLRDSWRFRPTQILVPELTSALRNAPALLLLRCLGIRVVMRLGNAPERGPFYDRLWGWVVPWLITRFIVNSQFSRTRLLETGVPADKIVLIQNAVSNRQVDSSTDADIVALARCRRTILCVGQVAPFKGTQLVVDATLRLLAEGCDVQAIIVGGFPDWPPEYVSYCEAMQQTVAAAGAEDRIHFVGSRQNVLEIMSASYLLAAPILQEETFGNVALEAKSVGLPVVTFPSGGLVELVEHKVTGYLCEDSTLDSFLDGLRYFLDDQGARSRAAAASVRSFDHEECPYRPEVFTGRVLSVFDSATTS